MTVIVLRLTQGRKWMPAPAATRRASSRFRSGRSAVRSALAASAQCKATKLTHGLTEWPVSLRRDGSGTQLIANWHVQALITLRRRRAAQGREAPHTARSSASMNMRGTSKPVCCEIS